MQIATVMPMANGAKASGSTDTGCRRDRIDEEERADCIEQNSTEHGGPVQVDRGGAQVVDRPAEHGKQRKGRHNGAGKLGVPMNSATSGFDNGLMETP